MRYAGALVAHGDDDGELDGLRQRVRELEAEARFANATTYAFDGGFSKRI